MTVQVGLIGCGAIARSHARDFYAAFPEEAHLVACADTDADRLERFAAEFGVEKAYASAAALLDDPEVAVVDICTPPAFHPQLIIGAARRGKHVLSEKPFALDLAAAAEAIRETERAGVRFMVMQNYRWRPEYAEAARILRDGRIGAPFLASIQALHHWSGGVPYRRDAERMLIIDQGIHYIDLLRFLVGANARTVHAVVGRSPETVLRGESYHVLTITFENGVVASLFESADAMGVAANWGAETIVQGTEGTLFVNRNGPHSLQMYSRASGGMMPARHFPPEAYTPTTNIPFVGPLRSWIQSVERNLPPPVPGADNIHSLAIALAAYDSSERGAPIDMAEYMASKIGQPISVAARA